MCFSAEASFGSAAALVAVGGYCVSRAVRNDYRYLPLALTPVFFGVQQAAEGFVWLGLHHDDTMLVQRASVVFLYFALAFWPFWIPFSLLWPEARQPARVFFVVMVALSVVWLFLFLPIAIDPSKWLRTEVVHHSIAYGVDDLPGFQLVPRVIWRLAYLAFIAGPLAVASPGGGGKRLRLIGGGTIAVLFAVSYGIYWYAFTSVWCFFAALLSLALGYLFYRLPERAAAQLTGGGALPAGAQWQEARSGIPTSRIGKVPQAPTKYNGNLLD
jgi:hypothetical protein